MATKKRKTKKSEDSTTTSESQSTVPAHPVQVKAKLDVSSVTVSAAKVPPAKRLFPSSLLAELDELKSRLEEVEKVLGINKHTTKEL
jgi:hypothetical protein